MSVQNRNAVVVEEGSEHYRRRWYAMLILSLSLMLVIMDGTIVNVAIPSIVEDFEGATFSDAEWVNTIYSLVYAATLILWGKIGDQYGRRLLFLIGVVLFGLGSALVGLSSSINMLIAMRVLQGIGAAILSPSTLSIITTTFKGKERGIAFGLWGATAGVAAALGPLVGGWVITHASWRWAFYINIPIVAAAFVGSLWAIRESRDEGTKHYFDILGTILGGFGLAALVFGIIEGQNYGWWKPDEPFTALGWEWPSTNLSIVPVSIAVGLVLLALFAWYERRLERANNEPLFEFGLLRYKSFRYGMFTGMIVNLGEIGILFALSLFLQGTKGLDAFDTGVALLPLAVTAFIGAPLAGAFSARLGPKWIVSLGMVIEAVALLILFVITTPDVSVTAVAMVLGLYGLGMGLAVAQLTNLVLYDIPAAKSGIASGGNSTIRQVGSALGIAIIGTVLTTSTGSITRDELRTSPILTTVTAAMEMAAGGDSAQGTGMTGSAMASGTMPMMENAQAQEDLTIEMAQTPVHFDFESMMGAGNPIALEYDRIFNKARSDAMANAALVAFIFISLGALSSLALPNPKGEAGEQAA